MRLSALFSVKNALRFALVAAGLVVAQSSVFAVNLPPSVMPPSGLAGTTVVYVTANGFPSGTMIASDVTVSFANGTAPNTCLGTPNATAQSFQVMSIPIPGEPSGYTRRFAVVIPSTLATTTYGVWLTSTTYGVVSTNCSQLKVTNTTKSIASCIPSSSLALALGTNVTAYVPKGNWESSATGIGIVNIEGTPGSTTVTTPHVVNACSSDSITGETVCTANNTDVYLLTGTTLNTTLTSGANSTAGFSGGYCQNCGVAIDAANSTAYIEEGVSGGGHNEGVQALNLNTNALSAPFPMHFAVSENIAIDPFLNYILSPGEDSNYTILQVAPSGTLTEYGKSVAEGDLDSAAEDCTTGIALSSSEFTSDVYIQDLTQAVFTAGTPGSYTAPGQFVTLTGTSYSAGTSGISVAPGSSHLGVVTGEFGGNTFSVLQLPSTSGVGTPTIVDFAFTSIPANPAGGSSPCGFGFSSGLDPHTLSAYTSPNDGNPYAVFANDGATCLVVVDMNAILAAPRISGTHTLTAAPPSAFKYFAIP